MCKGEMVNHPNHYNKGKYEVIDVIEDVTVNNEDGFIGFCLGNSLKYIMRAGHKDDIRQDLNKAIWYIQKTIDYIDERGK